MSYFKKVFCDELSPDNAEYDDQKRFDSLKKLYNYADGRKFNQSMTHCLLHEMLLLTIKLDNYQEDLFVKYLEFPIRFSILKDFDEKKDIHRAQTIQDLNTFKSAFKTLFVLSSNQDNVMTPYLEHLCLKNKGSLKKYVKYFKEYYLKEIEKKIQIYQSDKGLLELANDISPEEYKDIQD